VRVLTIVITAVALVLAGAALGLALDGRDAPQLRRVVVVKDSGNDATGCQISVSPLPLPRVHSHPSPA
jgi:hypothetical protein